MTISRRTFALGAVSSLGVTATFLRDPLFHRARAAHQQQVAPGTLKWKFPTGDWQVKHDPEYAGEVVIASHGRFVIAFDPSTGNYRWKYEATTDNLKHTRVDDVVYVSGWDSKVVALDIHSGEEMWSFTTSSAVHAAPTVVDGTLYVIGGSLHALDAVTGVERWSFSEHLGVHLAPAVGGGLVYIGAGDKNVYALDVETGVERWRSAQPGQIFKSPAYENGVVYVADGDICALDAINGAELWRVSSRVSSDPVILDGVLYVGVGGDFDGAYAIDMATGDVKWYSASESYVTGTPQIMGNTLYYHSHDARLHALDLETGAERWTFETPYGDPPELRISDGIITLGSGGVIALDAISGTEIWRTEVGPSDRFNASYHQDAIYFPGNQNTLYSLDISSGEEHWRFVTGSLVSYVEEIEGSILAVGPGNLHVIDAETGTGLWQVNRGESRYQPVYFGGVVILGDDNSTVALDATNGEQLWELPAGGGVFPIEDHGVFTNDAEGAYQLDTRSGQELWRAPFEHWMITGAAETLYLISNQDGSMYALDVASSDEKWRYTPAVQYFAAALIVDDYLLITDGESLEAINTESGQQVWRTPVDSWYWMEDVTLVNNSMIFGSSDDYGANLTAIDIRTGSISWNQFVAAESIYNVTTDGRAVYFGAYHGDTTTTLYSLDANTGEPRWQRYVEAGSPSVLAVVDGTLYVNFDSYSTLFVYDAETGAERWQLELDRRLSSPLIAVDGTLYFGSGDMNVYAIVAEPARQPSVSPDAAAVTTVEADVKAAPLASADVVSTLPAETDVYVTGSSKESAGVTWWPVIAPDGSEGWIDGSMLRGNP